MMAPTVAAVMAVPRLVVWSMPVWYTLGLPAALDAVGPGQTQHGFTPDRRDLHTRAHVGGLVEHHPFDAERRHATAFAQTAAIGSAVLGIAVVVRVVRAAALPGTSLSCNSAALNEGNTDWFFVDNLTPVPWLAVDQIAWVLRRLVDARAHLWRFVEHGARGAQNQRATALAQPATVGPTIVGITVVVRIVNAFADTRTLKRGNATTENVGFTRCNITLRLAMRPSCATHDGTGIACDQSLIHALCFTVTTSVRAVATAPRDHHPKQQSH